MEEEGEDVEFDSACRDIPNWFYMLELPIPFSAYFALKKVLVKDLIALLLIDSGREGHVQGGVEASELEDSVASRVQRGVRLTALALRKRAQVEGGITADRCERHDCLGGF